MAAAIVTAAAQYSERERDILYWCVRAQPSSGWIKTASVGDSDPLMQLQGGDVLNVDFHFVLSGRALWRIYTHTMVFFLLGKSASDGLGNY